MARRVRVRPGARIPGRVDLLDARLSNPGGTALRIGSSVIGEFWLGRGLRVQGVLNLRRAEINQLDLDPAMLPDQVRLLDLTSTFLTPHEPAERRLPMLARGGEGLRPARLRAVDGRVPAIRRRPGRPAGPARQAGPPSSRRV
ncbi:hypothetical protein ACFW2X_12550 [Streptomyces antibioticus]|uniref:hypothetical protein n=1 Tax=Streptomyces antibioticus TaxID=1890 RepID=UPI0036B661AC